MRLVHQPSLSSEAALLICCARLEVDTDRRQRIGALIDGEIDWAAFIRLANYHRLMPLVHWRLMEDYSGRIPDEIRRRLKDQFLETGRRNLALAGELTRLLDLFEEEGLAVTPYKGAVLAASVYGNLALRPFSDLDLLISESEVRRARDLLLRAGYEPERSLSSEEEADYFETNCELNFNRRDGEAHVELHWAIVPPAFSFSLDAEELNRRARLGLLSSRAIPNLSPEDLLLALCAHGCKHRWSRLFWICDVAEVLRAHEMELDWDALWRRAARLGSRRIVCLGLRLAADLLDADLPDEVVARIETDPAVKNLSLRVQQWLFAERDSLSSLAGKQLFLVNVRERFEDRIPLIRAFLRWLFVPPARDQKEARTSAFSRILRGLLRPFRLLRDYAFNLPASRR